MRNSEYEGNAAKISRCKLAIRECEEEMIVLQSRLHGGRISAEARAQMQESIDFCAIRIGNNRHTVTDLTFRNMRIMAQHVQATREKIEARVADMVHEEAVA